MATLQLKWFEGLSPKEKESLEFVLQNNPVLIPRLVEIIDSYEQEELRVERTKAQYDNPSWAYTQADRNGALRAYSNIKQLFKGILTSG